MLFFKSVYKRSSCNNHPQSQGTIEWSHQTLKSMMRSYWIDCDNNWDEGIHLLMFAARESIQDSLGFTPFELVFGHSACGPLKMLKGVWISDEKLPVNLLEYVTTFKQRLLQVCELAKQNLQRAQARMKVWYDKRTRKKSFKIGERCSLYQNIHYTG